MGRHKLRIRHLVIRGGASAYDRVLPTQGAYARAPSIKGLSIHSR